MEYLVNFIAEHWFEIALSIGTVWFGCVFPEWRKKRKIQLEKEARELANLYANLKKVIISKEGYTFCKIQSNWRCLVFMRRSGVQRGPLFFCNYKNRKHFYYLLSGT